MITLIRAFLLLLLFSISLTQAMAFPTWIRTYDYGSIKDIVAKANGHLVFAAQSGSVFTVVHTDENGDVIWETPITGSLYGFSSLSSDQFMTLFNTVDGFTLSGLNSSGQVIWSTPAPFATDIRRLIDTQDNCCVYASSDSLVKLNSDGSVRWTRSISPSMPNLAIINKAPGEYGGVSLAGSLSDKLQIGIADSSGTLLWTALGYHMVPSITGIQDVYGSINGNCYGAATFEIPMPPPVEWPGVLCFNPDSSTEWTETVANVKLLCESDDDNPIVIGIQNNLGDNDISIRKMVAQNGNTMWMHTHGIPEVADNCLTVSLCPDGGFAVGGSSGSNSLLLRIDSDGWINGTGIQESEHLTAALPPSPNPASTSLTIPFSTGCPGRVSIQIIDLAGRLVVTLPESDFQAGLHSVNWDLKDSSSNSVSNGFYSVIITTGDAVMTERVMILR